jgi:thymidylate kinase
MTTVALIGADGAGKTTVARRLEAEGRLPVKYLYLGVDAEAANHLLLTTRVIRWARRRRGDIEDRTPLRAAPVRSVYVARPARRRPARALRAWAGLANLVAEEWYRLAVAAWFERRGHIVVFDSHPRADFAAHDMATNARLPPERRLHGCMLRRLHPAPDLTVVLDAPPETLRARTGEASLADLERRREDRLAVREGLRRVVVVDASGPLDDVVRAVEHELRVFAGAVEAR